MAHTMHRLIIAAPMSGSGKTTVTAGLIAALVARGLRVAPFKVGPDYIDPTYHSLAAGEPCHNLDPWLLPPERILASFVRRSRHADIALIEGVMGLFDGLSGVDDSGSAAHIARLLNAPVLLVLDASAMARSAGAIVRGFRDFDPKVRLAGVILNQVGGARHAQMVREAIEENTGVPVLGYLAHNEALHLPERHLGLIPTAEPRSESSQWQTWVQQVRAAVEETIDVARVVAQAKTAGPLPTPAADDPFTVWAAAKRAVIAVAYDAAFNFVYADNLDLLGAAGAEIARFSPLRDATLPRGTQGIYLCGGFPELYATGLAQNVTLLAQLRRAHAAGLPIYAECGGLMYLTGAIIDAHGKQHTMAGLLPGCAKMQPRLTLGYRTLRALVDNWLWRAGEEMRGHEFHYSTWCNRAPSLPYLYEIQPDAYHSEPQLEGAWQGNLLASYTHLHFLTRPELAARFVLAASLSTPWGWVQ
ncbi:MAG: cobyrinate a,c-diamide synthase [Chloroflexi bacterium]|nr:MAG: cobyrinate a,c-diamide synthase [Chloroflexota bacterium]